TMNNSFTIENELKAAINNDQITQLIKGIFKADGSLNNDNIADLALRINANHNIDNRDNKNARINILFKLAKQINNPELNSYVAHLNELRSKDINFFREGLFATHLNDLTNKIAAIIKKSNTTQSSHDITTILNDISERYAQLITLAMDVNKNVEQANTYIAIAEHFKTECLALSFDGTSADDLKLQKLSQLDIAHLQQKMLRYYASNDIVQSYYDNKKQINHHMHEKLQGINKPSVESFLQRNSMELIYGTLVGLLYFAGIALLLISGGLLAPLSIALIAVSVAVTASMVATGPDIYKNEQKYAKSHIDYANEINSIKEDHQNQVIKAEHSLQKGINVSVFIEPKKPDFVAKIDTNKKKPLTAERVAHALWLQDKDTKTTTSAKNRFSMWASHQTNLGFGVEEVEQVLKEKYEMKL
ncbi:MAG: hypothetical protein PSV35_09915, partial [bacterium]|nr:hypothetical protein [bacterium]